MAAAGQGMCSETDACCDWSLGVQRGHQKLWLPQIVKGFNTKLRSLNVLLWAVRSQQERDTSALCLEDYKLTVCNSPEGVGFHCGYRVEYKCNEQREWKVDIEFRKGKEDTEVEGRMRCLLQMGNQSSVYN